MLTFWKNYFKGIEDELASDDDDEIKNLLKDDEDDKEENNSINDPISIFSTKSAMESLDNLVLYSESIFSCSSIFLLNEVCVCSLFEYVK